MTDILNIQDEQIIILDTMDFRSIEIDTAALRMAMALNLPTDYCAGLIEQAISKYEEPIPNWSELVAHAVLLSKEECYICHKKEHYKTDGRGRILCCKCANYKGEPIVFETRKIGRNEPCPCGSGLKYKACCRKLVR